MFRNLGQSQPQIGPTRRHQANVIACFPQRLCVCSGTSDHRHTISDWMSLPCLCSVKVQRRIPLPSDEESVSGSDRSNVPTHSKYLCATKATDSGRGASSPFPSPSNAGTVGVRRTGSFSLSSCESNRAKRIGVCDSGERKLAKANAWLTSWRYDAIV